MMNTPSSLGIKKGTKILSDEGWKPQTYYIVDVAFCSSNPIHRKIFYSGFLDKNGRPNGYNEFGFTEDRLTISDAYYIKVIREIDINEQSNQKQQKSRRDY